MITFRPISPQQAAEIILAAAAETQELAPILAAAPPPPERLAAFYEPDERWGIFAGEEPIGALLIAPGPELHLAVRRAWRRRWLGKGFYRFLAERYTALGAMIARTRYESAREFVSRFSPEPASMNADGRLQFRIAPPFGLTQERFDALSRD